MYAKYLTYIRLAKNPTVQEFDEDWDPIGHTLRADMTAADLIEEIDGRLYIKREPK